MRALALLALIPCPALAWEFRPDPVCTLSHDAPGIRVVVTRDPAAALPYAIALTLSEGAWPPAPAFHIAFSGDRRLTIGTGGHVLSDEGRTLTVRDTGFGNVLDGLEFNATARAWSGLRSVDLDLAGAAPAVQAFRDCATGAGLV